MSTHKHFDKICCVVLALTLLVSVLFVNAEKLGIEKASTVMGYETAIFDNSKVHTIDIVMDNWDEFLENCRSEEYYNCSVVIDNEAYKNVAIRGKGNTSLSSVDSYGNNRYSFKIEFDHYDNTNTYYGLDKLVLNNLIQDNTYMKDYLTYQMMGETGVAAPLCSYVYITVNGEDWGLYLAVEGVEESFLQRNYGKDYGELYKPDSMNMGGGRGNGKDFDMDAFMNSEDFGDSTTATTPGQDGSNDENGTTTVPDSGNSAFPQLPEGMTPPDMGSNPFTGEMPEGFTFPEGTVNPFTGQMTEGMTPPSMSGENFGVSDISTNSSSSQTTQLSDVSFTPPSGSGMPSMGGMGGFNFDIDEETVREAFKKLALDESLLDGIDFENISMTDVISLISKLDEDTVEKLMQEIMGSGVSGMPPFGGDFSGDFSGNMPGGFGGFGMGSSDVKLQYIDDDADSYSNIFSSAKTAVSKADESRLIKALRKLSNGEEIENTVDIEAVIRYFVVHNFVVNSDSYTGTMIHNYYLYEKDGQMQMIPWDYNLAFGSFMSMGSATSSVNDPIDTPLSVSGNGDRPMIDWIFSNEEYTELYHQYFSEFISKYFDSGYFESFIDSTISMISPYVEKDPTKFCTYEEFEKGSETLKEFCQLRAQSVKGQLDGTIGLTSATQVSDTLIDASNLNTSDMGSMGGMGGMSFSVGDMKKPQSNTDESTDGEDVTEKPSTYSGFAENNGESNSRPQMPDGFQSGSRPDFSGSESSFGQGDRTQRPDGDSRTDNIQSQFNSQSIFSPSSLVMLVVSVLLLGFGLLFALKYKRRR